MPGRGRQCDAGVWRAGKTANRMAVRVGFEIPPPLQNQQVIDSTLHQMLQKRSFHPSLVQRWYSPLAPESGEQTGYTDPLSRMWGQPDCAGDTGLPKRPSVQLRPAEWEYGNDEPSQTLREKPSLRISLIDIDQRQNAEPQLVLLRELSELPDWRGVQDCTRLNKTARRFRIHGRNPFLGCAPLRFKLAPIAESLRWTGTTGAESTGMEPDNGPVEAHISSPRRTGFPCRVATESFPSAAVGAGKAVASVSQEKCPPLMAGEMEDIDERTTCYHEP